MIKKILFGVIGLIVVTSCQSLGQEQSQPIETAVEATRLVNSPKATQLPSESATLAPTLTPTITFTPTIALPPTITPTPDMYWFDPDNEYWPQEPLGREYYAYAWKGEERIPELNQAIQEAYTDGELWVLDPIEVGLKYAGYPNIDDIPPGAVYVFYIGNVVVVVVRTGWVGDDSIYEVEERVDLIKDGETWRIEWAGYRQRCRRYSDPSDWRVGLCS